MQFNAVIYMTMFETLLVLIGGGGENCDTEYEPAKLVSLRFSVLCDLECELIKQH